LKRWTWKCTRHWEPKACSTRTLSCCHLVHTIATREFQTWLSA